MPTVCVTNQKGGCGKTVTAVNLAAGLARKGLRTLIVDLDPQAPVAPGLGVVPGDMPTLAEAIIGKGRAGERVVETSTAGLSVMPGDASLDHETLVKVPLPDTVLQRALKPLRARFDWIVIDTPPHIDFVTFNAIMASDRLILPCDADKESLQSLQRTIEVAFAYVEHRPEIDPATFYRVLQTIHDDRDRTMNTWLAGELERLQAPTFKTVIHRTTALKKARAFGMSIFDFNDRHRGYTGGKRAVEDFEQLTDEVVSDV